MYMGKSILTCDYCSNEFERNDSEIKRAISRGNTMSFCSRKCGTEYKKKQIVYHTFTCLNCNCNFDKTEREVKNAKRNQNEIKFCSQKCKSDYWGRNRVQVTCEICSKEFLRQSKDVNNHNYCSKKCYDVFRKSLQTKINCMQCNRSFDVLKSDLENQHKTGSERVRTCSEKCYKELKSSYYEIISCKNCLTDFSKLKSNKGRVFCSNDCKQNYWDRFHRVTLNCDYCGSEFTTKKSQFENGKRFCDQECWNAYRAKEKEEYGEISHYLRSTKQYEQWRDSILQNANYTCEECGVEKNKFHAHHIIHLYDIAKKYEFDISSILNSEDFNDVANGQCLCVKCHELKHPGLQRNSDGTFCRLDAEPY